jgi:hypothetical protein
MVGGTHGFPGDQRLFFVAAAVKNKGKKNEKCSVQYFLHTKSRQAGTKKEKLKIED